jgi:hypothetical protein
MVMGFGNGYGQQVIQEKKESSVWEVEADYVDSCSKSPESVNVIFEPLAKVKVSALMKHYKGMEWLAYLVGKELTVSDIRIPKQTASSASVTDIDTTIVDEDIIGVIHSHHGMGSKFSGTDEEWINKNNDISLCISNNGIEGHVRFKTECGCYKLIKANVSVDLCISFNEDEFIEDAKTLINKHTFVQLPTKIYPSFTQSDRFSDLDGNEDDVDELNFDEDDDSLESELKKYEESGMFNDEDEIT